MTQQNEHVYEAREAVEAEERWNAGKPFFMTLTVAAPYDGCFYEPNIFLVTPPKCELFGELMSGIPKRYSREKERARARLDKAKTAYLGMEQELNWSWSVAHKERGYYGPDVIAREFGRIPGLFDALGKAEEELWAAEAEFAVYANEKPMPQPDICVWPLYASGQGMCLDAIHSLDDLIMLIEEGETSSLGNRETWPDALEGSRFEKQSGFRRWGRIRHVTFGDFSPISEVSYTAERYWMQALAVASELYGIALQWKCPNCGKIINYDAEDPETFVYPTGSHGDGGVGIHYTNVVCYSCLENGACEACKNAGCGHETYYSEKIAEHGWHLCEYCAEAFAQAISLKKAENVEFGESVIFRRSENGIICYAESGACISNITFDQGAACEWLRNNYVDELLDDIGLHVSGEALENAAEDLEE